ncbi:MAG TPA: hypothetical protein VD794_08400 [Flavisolibacter sp.]|nr:hypothetical protein [Flavisolibacter sp.]
MQKLTLGFLSLILFSAANAQGKPELDLYLANKGISKAAKDYYQGKFKAEDNNRAFSILDSIKTNNAHNRQFYLYLATQMMRKSDGALSEELGVRTKAYLEQYPNWALAFLQGKLADTSFNGLWAKIIAGEINIDCEGNEKHCASEWYREALKRTSTKYQSALKTLYKQVAAQCP